MNSDIFIKVSLDAAIKKYLLFRNKKDASGDGRGLKRQRTEKLSLKKK